ncbi:MAG: methyltransferase domain-containing protein [Ignavibacteria bacterium]|nr:methyltransferase domain-containing protein [Ignavibacteria bacterium]
MPFEDASFDLVFLGHVLHEADDLLHALAEAEALRPRPRGDSGVAVQGGQGTAAASPPAEPDDILLALGGRIFAD